VCNRVVFCLILVVVSLPVLAAPVRTCDQLPPEWDYQTSEQAPRTLSIPVESGRQTFMSLQNDQQSAVDADFKRISVLDDVQHRRQQQQVVQPAKDIWLDLPSPMTYMGPIDCDIRYECTGASFVLQRVDLNERRAVESQLETLTGAAMSDCHEVQNDYENHQLQTRCRFVRKIHYSPAVFQQVAGSVLASWEPTLRGETIYDLWIEGAARVSSKGLPLEKLPNTRPIALSTDKATYLVVEQVRPSEEFARQLAVSGQRLFSFENYADLRGSILNVMRLFNEELEKNFSASPLLARRASDEPQLDGEMILKRERGKSFVIGRESWLPAIFNSAYELSTYTVKWYSADKTSMVSSTAHGFFGKGAAETFGPNVFVEIEHVFLIAADGINYRETIVPEEQMNNYLALYRKAVDEAFRKSQKDTCYKRLAGKGMMANGTCDVRGDVK
jgi:hypothetical protein